MDNFKINQNLIHKLSGLLDNHQVTLLIEKYNKEILSQQKFNDPKPQQSDKNTTAKKPKRLGSQSKQRLLLRRKQSKKVFQQQAKSIQQQGPIQRAGTSQQTGPKKLIKDKAVFVNVNQLPYLHSTDLLNHLYKKSSNFGQQKQTQTPLYNPPLNNLYALTKVKHLHIYYCKIQSLRDMGTGWSNLIQLSIYFGKLKDLSGLNAFPSLQYLHCPFNSISTLSDLMFHPTLLSIDLQFNQITDFAEVQHLFTVQSLEYVNLLNNPVYSNKQTKRKINEKFQKIIESDNTRLQEYVYDKRREIWQLQSIHGIEYCNNLLKEFYQQSRQDEITLQTKYQYLYKNQQHNELDFEAFQANFNNQTTKSQNNEENERTLKIEYIAPQIPQNAYFQEFIMNGTQQSGESGRFCEQKIYLSPLTQMIDKGQTFLGPVLNKYLSNKLYIRDEMPREKIKIKQHQAQSQIEQKSQAQKSKMKKISKMSLTGFSNKGMSQTGYASTVVSNLEESSQQIETINEFQKTSTSFSTNCTNMNNTSTNFAFRRTRPSLSKSKEKSLNKTSLISKLTQNIAATQNINKNTVNNHQLHSSSLVKHSRMLLGRASKKQGIQQSIQKANQRGLQQHQNKGGLSLQKTSYSTTLKRKTLLSSSNKQKSMILKRQLQI